MKITGRVSFLVFCVIAGLLLIVALLVFAGIGVKDNTSPPTSAPGTRVELALS